ncbi:MAG: hypothetical protein U0X58_04025 [Flavobacteriaceae bacterium]
MGVTAINSASPDQRHLSGTTYTLSGTPTTAGVYSYTQADVQQPPKVRITVNPDATIVHSSGSVKPAGLHQHGQYTY